MQTWNEAADLFKTARNKQRGKPISSGNHTRLMKRGDNYAVMLHETDVVTFYPDGRIKLDTGGWKTLTTRQRMDEFTPAWFWQEKGLWHFKFKGEHYLFGDGPYTLHPDGKVTNGDGSTVPVFDPEAEKAAVKYRRKVGTYAKKFIDALYAGEIPAPSNGDCWHCLMTVTGGKDDGKGLGEAVRCGDHIRSHIDENYFVPSLLKRALDWRSSQVMQWEVAALLKWPDTDEYAQHRAHAAKWNVGGFGSIQDDLVKMVRRYCLKEMGLPH